MKKTDLPYTIVTKPGIRDLLSLPKMFDKALEEDFTLYDKSTRERIKNRYSLLNLLFARLRKGRLLLLAQHEEKCIGVLLAGHTSDGIGMVYWIYVAPEYRKKGVAKMLIKSVEKEFRERNCHKSVVTTEKAQSFYQRIGYMEEAIFKKHWWGKDFSVFSKFI